MLRLLSLSIKSFRIEAQRPRKVEYRATKSAIVHRHDTRKRMGDSRSAFQPDVIPADATRLHVKRVPRRKRENPNRQLNMYKRSRKWKLDSIASEWSEFGSYSSLEVTLFPRARIHRRR